MDDRLFIVIDPHAELIWCGDKITNSGHLGQVDARCSQLATATYPEGKRLDGLPLNARIDGVKFSASGETGIYSVVRVR